MNNSLLKLHDMLRSQGVLISFSGKFSQEIIEELGQAVRKYLETEEKPSTDIYNTFSIFVEQTQNIKKYCTQKQGSGYYEKIADSCIIVIGKTDNGIYISSGNLLENSDIAGLVGKLEKLIPLDKTELKKLYKAKLKEEISNWSQGAGLGLVDMARKASIPLKYSVTRLDDGFSFFTLKAIV
ncbi:MAG: SiaB family protein kinase [Peptococcaceae bacterium]